MLIQDAGPGGQRTDFRLRFTDDRNCKDQEEEIPDLAPMTTKPFGVFLFSSHGSTTSERGYTKN